MSNVTRSPGNNNSVSSSNGGEVRYDGKNVTSEHFSLKSSKTKPFDLDSMSGSQTSSNNESSTNSESGSDKN